MKLKGRDWLGAAATLFALAVTFNAEYEIAIAVHIHPLVAYAVPGALDVYVLRALQVKRDVFLTVLAMVAVNAASHLVTAGVLRVSPALIVAVSAIAPLVLWRAHVLRHAVSTAPAVPPVPEHVPDTQAQIRAQTDAWGDDWNNVPDFDEHAAQAVDVASTGTVNVPVHDDMGQITRAWHAKHITGCTCPVCSDEWDGTVVDLQGNTEHAFPAPGDIVYPGEYEASTETRVLALVPPLPAGFEPVLADGDKEFLDRARELDVLSIRALKSLGMGNGRAQRIQQYLKSENTEARS